MPIVSKEIKVMSSAEYQKKELDSKVETGKPVVFDPVEKRRIYIFPGKKVRIRNVQELIVRESGTHRIKTKGGKKLYIIPTGWVGIIITTNKKDWTV